MEQSLFDSFNARFLRPSQIAERFVIPSHFQQVCERNHSVIIGPRGSGKTTLLKMLQVGALRAWHPKRRSKFIDEIDFTAIYVAADRSWSSLFEGDADFHIPNELSDMIALALFIVYLQFSFIDTLEELSQGDLVDDPSLARFHIPQAEVESELAQVLSRVWLIDGRTPTYFILRSRLAERLNEIAAISDSVRFGSVATFANIVSRHPFLSLRYEFMVRNTVEAINICTGTPHRKWCICLDELEIVPRSLRRMLYLNLRSADQRVLFKISLSPFSLELFPSDDQTTPIAGQDYAEIYLSYPRSSDAQRFGREILSSLLHDVDLANVSAETIFGSSSIAVAEHSGRVPIAAYRAPDGARYQLIANLEVRDKSFQQYLRKRRYNIEHMPQMPESRRAELRKLIQICRARIEFRRFGEGQASGVFDRPGFRRSRKRIHPMYTGLESLLAICEGNPRWVIGILRPQVLQYKRLSEHGNRGSLDRAYQARHILAVIRRYRALLGTIPLKGGRSGSGTSVLQLIDKIGNYMFRDVVLGPFKPEPVLSFVVDRRATRAQVEALGAAVNQGALVLIPNRKGDTTSGTIVHSRFRLSYLLAPDFQLPLTYGTPKDLSEILMRIPRQEQMRLEDL